MTRVPFGRRWFALAIATSLLFPVLFAVTAPVGASVTGSEPSPLAGRGMVLALPSALLRPWADRTGFSSTFAAGTTATEAATGPLDVTVTFWPRDLGLFTRTGPPLDSAAAVGAAYGLTPQAYTDAQRYFTGAGLTVTHTWPDRLSLSVRGPAAAVGHAFGTTLERGVNDGRSVQYPLSAARLPFPLNEEVSAVSGLSAGFTQFTLPFTPVPAPAKGADVSPLALRTSSLIYPTALHTIYDLDGLYNYSGTPHFANGVGIALVLWGEGYDPSDIASFYQSFYPSSFPPVTVTADPVAGAPPPSAQAVADPSGATQEMTLDLEWSGSEAPGATLHAVYAPDGPASNNYSPTDPSMETALNTAVNSLPGVEVVSMSFGTLDGSDPSFQAAYATAFSSAAAHGITVLAASGDTGGLTKAGCQGSDDPQFPASSPQVLAVGGTAPVLSLNALGGVTGLDSEPAWSGSGGGFSRSYAAPSWQEVGSAAGPISASGERGTPDVAGPSADNFMWYDGQQAGGKGTSFAAPAWAGIIAEMDAIRGQPLGLVAPRLYSVGASEEAGTSPQGLVDITSGGNCLGPAGPGWDTATGWGSPRGLGLLEALSFSFVDLRIQPADSSLTPGTETTLHAEVLNATSQQPIPGLPVSFSLSAIGSVGLCLGTLSTANATTDASGVATAQLDVPTCYFGTAASLAASVAAAGFYGSNSTTLEVNLLGLAGSLYIIQVYPYNLIVFGGVMAFALLVGWALGRRRPRPPPAAPPARPVAAPAPRPPPVAPPPRPPP